jgi:AraC-like DNA-binding protein
MVYREFAPDAVLQPYIDAYWLVDGSEGPPFVNRILPDGCIDIIYNLGEDSKTENGAINFQNEKVYLLGTMTRYKHSEVRDGSRLLGIRFKPGAFLCFYKFSPLSEIVNTTIEFEKKLVPQINLGSKHVTDRLNRFFLDRLNSSKDILSPVMARVIKHKGNISVEELGRQSDMNLRRLERGFKAWLGISPKEFIGFTRYQAALKTLQAKPAGKSLLDIAFDHGYYDHSHLTNAVKKYAGMNPSDF